MKKASLLLALVFVLSLPLTACSPRAEEGPMRVNTAVSEERELDASVEIAGVLLPAGTSAVSAKSGGRVSSLSAAVGDIVSKGDTLITLDTSDLLLQLKQAQAALDTAQNQSKTAKLNMDAAKTALELARETASEQTKQADIARSNADVTLSNAQIAVSTASLGLDNAKKALDRVKTLYDIGEQPLSALEQAQTAYDQAKNLYGQTENQYTQAELAVRQAQLAYDQARGIGSKNQITAAQSKYDAAKLAYDTGSGAAVAQGEASVGLIENQLENAVIKAPISGVIVNVNISEGELASPGVSLLTVSDVGTLVLRGTVPQDVLPYVTRGFAAKLTADIYPDKALSGMVRSLGPISVSTGGYFPIEIEVQNPSLSLTAGLTAHCSLPYKTVKRVTVPSAAVTSSGGESFVFTEDGGKAVKRIVLTGVQAEGVTQILEGLLRDERVIVTNVRNLYDGMPVMAEER